MRTIALVLISVSASASGACVVGANGSASGASPSAADYDAIAGALAAAHVPGDTGAMDAVIGIALGGAPTAVTPDAEGGASSSYQVLCRNESGLNQIACSRSIDRASAVVGDGDRTTEWSLSALQSGTAQIDGTGASVLDAAQPASWRLAFASTYTGVAVDVASHAATAGAIDDDIEATRADGSGDGSIDIDAALTFQPDGSAVLVLDGARRYAIARDGSVSQP